MNERLKQGKQAASCLANQPADDAWRPWICLSYVLFLVAGIPLWWKTTLVYRASLPYSQVEALYTEIESGTWTINRRILARVWLVGVPSGQTVTIGLDRMYVQEAGLAGFKDAMDVTMQYVDASRLGPFLKDVESVVSYDQLDSLLDRLKPTEGGYDVFVFSLRQLPEALLPAAGAATVVRYGRSRKIIYAATDELEHFSPEYSLELVVARLFSEPLLLPTSNHLKHVQTYQITFTLLVAEPDQTPVLAWEAKEAFHQYFEPLLAAIQSYADFRVDFQIRYHAETPVRPEVRGGESLLSHSQLQVFLRSSDWNLESSISDYTPLHFLVYLPSRPLFVTDDRGKRVRSNSFIYPQWGGVYISNRNSDGPIIGSLELRPIMHLFAGQLKRLLAISYEPLVHIDPGLHDVDKSQMPATGIYDWEFDALLSRGLLENYLASVTTLHSLARMITSITELPVADSICAMVTQAMAHLESCKEVLQDTGDHVLAYGHTRKALALAESAFFDPSMVARMYFPQDHKYAVYTPLFFPVILPICVAMLRLVLERMRAKDVKAKSQ